MSRSYCYFLAVSFLSSAGTLHAQVETGKELKAKILAEWKSLLETINTARWETRIEYHSSRDPEHLRLGSVDIVRRAFNHKAGSLWSSEVDRFDEKKKVTTRSNELQITNHRYTADLRTSKGGDGWVLSELKQGPKDVAKRLGQEVPCQWMTVGNVRLNEWLEEAAFIFTRIENRPQPPTGVLRAYFAYNGSRGGWPDGIKSGYIDFDPTRSYRPMCYQYDIKAEDYEGTMRGLLEYDNAAGIPVLKLMLAEEQHRSKRKGLIFGKEIHSFSNVQYNGAVRDEEFRLSAYGLPEPQGVLWETSSRWYLWFIALALVCLAVGGFLWRRVRRHRLMTET